jgi:hypothetical protein
MGRKKKSKGSVANAVTASAPASLFSNLIYYRQGRVDGGIHTGVDALNEPLLESFENEAPYDESDPVLAWYIEVRCKGDGLPTTVEGARAWLLQHQQLIRSGLNALAEELSVGLDAESYPYFWRKFPLKPTEVELTLVCSAHRRSNGIGLGRQVRAFADHFEEYLKRMSEVRPITA